MDLLESLIIVSEKAANIARLCRQNQHLFQLLIQKKSSDEANPRFVEDFKTLADVLIQEMVKHEIGTQFPHIRDSIQGEENNKFCNKLGESILVEIKDTLEETADLLKIVLNGDAEAAELLAAEVHKNVLLSDVNVNYDLPKLEYNISNLGIWIDPIDSTAEYINGQENVPDFGISTNGLGCVTVLLGVYQKNTGLPYMGIVNQPFYKKENERWIGNCIWGIADLACENPYTRKNIISISSSEKADIINKLTEAGFNIVEASGAGYKILSVITNLADAYVLTKNSTFKWDTCGPQAILKSMGGDLIVFDEAMNNNIISVKYSNCEQNTCNIGGIIAYKNEEILYEILRYLQK